MKLLLSWLGDHLEGAASADEIARRLTAAGLNVETRDRLADGAGAAGGDEVWDVDVTTNRPDAMNHRGLAREAAAAGCGALRPLAPAVPEGAAAVADLARLTVADLLGCPRYCARVIRAVRVGPSPAWLADRLEKCGIRPINNVVDATNYVLLDLGQPLHAFDLARLAGQEIIVRRARAGEAFTTLDGEARVLEATDVVIADRDRAVALAGVMGGANSEIAADTRDVLLESACFDPTTVRRTSHRLGLSTEASVRFERGADPVLARTAVDAAAALIQRLAGGEVAAGVLDSAAAPPAPRSITFSHARLEAFAGCTVPRQQALDVLSALELAPRVEADAVTCTVPSFRVDLELAEDLYEEVLRHFGYDNIPSRLPEGVARPGGLLGSWPLTERARDALAAAGVAEAVTYAFVASEMDAASAGHPLAERGSPLALANPLSARAAVMRRSLLAGLAEAAAGNLRRGGQRVLIGEVGRVFFARDGGAHEEERLAIACAGEAGSWDAARTTDFLDLKGVVTAVCEELGITEATWRGGRTSVLASGGSAELVWDGRVIGIAGQLADSLAALVDAPAAVWVAEIDLAGAAARTAPRFVAPPRFPAVTADLTVRHHSSLTYGRLEAAIRAAAPAWLAEVRPVVRYHGEGVGADEVKTTVRLVYRHGDRSLTQDEVNAAHFALMDALGRGLGVSFT